MKPKVFISFDYENDNSLKDTLIGQADLPDSPFSIVDMSLRQEAPDWQQKARSAIDHCDVFIILLGDHTHQAPGVIRELRMAIQLKKKRFQLRKQGHFPIPIEGAGDIFAWKWKNLKSLVAPGNLLKPER